MHGLQNRADLLSQVQGHLGLLKQCISPLCKHRHVIHCLGLNDSGEIPPSLIHSWHVGLNGPPLEHDSDQTNMQEINADQDNSD